MGLISDEVANGEMFSPGYDCMSILDRYPNAKDGFYWITLNTKKPRKVHFSILYDFSTLSPLDRSIALALTFKN